MDELLQRLTANGFAELEGLQVTGILPVRQDLINDALTTLLLKAQGGGSAQTAAPPASAAASFSPPPPKPAAPAANWLKLISKLQVQLQDGKAVIAFELRR